MSENAESQVPSLDHNSVALIFNHLPHNDKVLAVKSLNRFWHDWATQQLNESASMVRGREYIPLWVMKDRGIMQLSAAQQDEVMGQLEIRRGFSGCMSSCEGSQVQ